MHSINTSDAVHKNIIKDTFPHLNACSLLDFICCDTLILFNNGYSSIQTINKSKTEHLDPVLK